jgi:hypothetical protein
MADILAGLQAIGIRKKILNGSASELSDFRDGTKVTYTTVPLYSSPAGMSQILLLPSLSPSLYPLPASLPLSLSLTQGAKTSF